MTFRIFFILSLLFLLGQPAAAQENQGPASTCAASDNSTVDYVQRGDDIILMECPAMEGGNAACTCHDPPGTDGQCRVYACNADGSPKGAEVKPAPPPVKEEKAEMAPKHEDAKPHAKKKKSKVLPKKDEITPAPAVVEEKKADVPPKPDISQPAPASSEKNRIEYSR